MLLNKYRGLNIHFFLSLDRLTSRNDVTSNKVDFKRDIRQNFRRKKIRKSRVNSTLEQQYLNNKYQTQGSKCPLASSKFKDHLVALSHIFFSYALKLNIQPNKEFFMTKVHHFIQDVKRKTTAIYQRGAKPIITKEYKGRFFNNYHIKS